MKRGNEELRTWNLDITNIEMYAIDTWKLKLNRKVSKKQFLKAIMSRLDKLAENDTTIKRYIENYILYKYKPKDVISRTLKMQIRKFKRIRGQILFQEEMEYLYFRRQGRTDKMGLYAFLLLELKEEQYKKLTFEQHEALRLIYKLSYYERKSEVEELNYNEEQDADLSKAELLLMLKKFIGQRIYKRTRGYKMDRNANENLMHLCLGKVWGQVHNYNPLLVTPTTFFVHYIDEGITEYFRELGVSTVSQNELRKRHYIKNLLNGYEHNRLKKEDGDYETKLEFLQRNTSYSVKILKQALVDIEGHPVSLDACINVANHISVEKEVEQEQELNRYFEHISTLLTKDDYLFFRQYFDIHDSLDLGRVKDTKNHEYKTLGKVFDLDLNAVKDKLAAILEILQNDDEILALRGEHHKDVKEKPKKQEVSISFSSNNATSTLKKQIMDSIE